MQHNTKYNQVLRFIEQNSSNNKCLLDRFSIDSRQIKKDQVFISLASNISKNIKNIKHAISRGAYAFITTCPISRRDIITCNPYLVIKEMNQVIIDLYITELKDLSKRTTLIGITGTNGKTSTSLVLAQALTLQNKRVGIISSEGIGVYPHLKHSAYTTPPIDTNYKSLKNFLTKKCDYIIIECSSQGLHQGRLDVLIFNYSLITNIHQDHIEYHKSQKNYINSKLKILNQSLTKILNYDSLNLKNIDAKKFNCRRLFYISQKKIKNKKVLNTTFKPPSKNTSSFNIYTLMMVAAIMKFEKFNEVQINKSISNLSPVLGRRHFITTKDKGVFIIDYAHTVEAYRELFKEICTNKETTTLFGCGGDRDKSKRRITGGIVDQYSTNIIITEDNSRSEKFSSIYRDIREGIKDTKKITIIKSRKKAIKHMFNMSSSNKLNFILGKGNENFIYENNKIIKHNDIICLKKIIENHEHKTI